MDTNEDTAYDASWMPAVAMAKARRGYCSEDIARILKVPHKKLVEWAKEHEELGSALKNGRLVARCQLENAIFSLATGAKESDVKTEYGKGKEEIVKRTETIKHKAPSLAAARLAFIFLGIDIKGDDKDDDFVNDDHISFSGETDENSDFSCDEDQ
jgi:hypothetical protein